MNKIKVGIIGGAGYTAGELLRLLVNHPQVKIVFVHSKSNAGNSLTDVHSGLVGEIGLTFTDQLLMLNSVDVLFLCTAHGDSKLFLEQHPVREHIKVIDLSTDFRHARTGNDFVYGLPELNKESIENARHVANPGCFATGIQLALLPLANNHLLTEDIHINAITGTTGAGVKPSATSHFSWRNNNISIYKPFTHQHLKEIGESICQLQPTFNHQFHFLPVRGNFARGIFVTAYTRFNGSLEDANRMYQDFYHDAAFTFVVKKNPDLKQVVNTNKALIYLEKHGEQLLVVSVIDNLLKGASGQAVQNMNIMMRIDEKFGLQLKSIGF